MKEARIVCFCILIFLAACRNTQTPVGNTISELPLLDKNNLVAWCIVPFDSKDRTPADRAAMLKELGISKFAYDWREEHLTTFPDELIALKENDVELSSVWFWIDNRVEPIDENNERFFKLIEEHGVQTEMWICLNDKVFNGLDEQELFDKAVEIVDLYYTRAKSLGCTIALYNHGDWFGEPANQIKIIKALGYEDIKIVYNFHHAHNQLDYYPVLISKMLPYLSCVNLNGMGKDGKKIIPLGSGTLEQEMLKVLIDSGYDGHVGILGHVEEEDVNQVLQRNLKGLALLEKELSKGPATQ